MVRTLRIEHVFHHPWSQVTEAAWRKYPHPLCNHITSVDVIDREVDKQGHLRSKRLFTCKGPVPYWIQAFVGNEPVHALEESVVRPQDKVMEVTTKSLSFPHILQTVETVKYEVHPENPEWTIYRQEVSFEAFRSRLAHRIEEFLLNRFLSSHSPKGRTALEDACQRVYRESMAKMKEARHQLSAKVEQKIARIEDKLSKSTQKLEERFSHQMEDRYEQNPSADDIMLRFSFLE